MVFEVLTQNYFYPIFQDDLNQHNTNLDRVLANINWKCLEQARQELKKVYSLY